MGGRMKLLVTYICIILICSLLYSPVNAYATEALTVGNGDEFTISVKVLSQQPGEALGLNISYDKTAFTLLDNYTFHSSLSSVPTKNVTHPNNEVVSIGLFVSRGNNLPNVVGVEIVTLTFKVTDNAIGNYSFQISNPEFCTVELSSSEIIVSGGSTTHTVTFDTNDADNATDTAFDSQSIDDEDTATEPTTEPTKEGFTFGGWYTSEDEGATLSEAPFDFGTPITGDITLYAKWTAVVPEPTTAKISVGGITAGKGGTVKVPVRITDNPGFFAYNLIPAFDDTYLTLGGVSAGDYPVPEYISETGVIQLQDNEIESDYTQDEGILFYLNFTVAENAPISSIPVSIGLYNGEETALNFVNKAEQDVAVGFESGSVNVAAYSASGLDATYDGTEKTVTVSGTGEIVVLYNGETTAPINAGSYPVTIIVDGDEVNPISVGTLVIAKAEVQASALPVPGVTGDVREGALLSGVAIANATSTYGAFAWDEDSNTVISLPSGNAPLQYSIKFTVNANYTLTDSAATSLEIAKDDIQILGDLDFDGVVTAADSVRNLNIATGVTDLTDYQVDQGRLFWAANINKDDAITTLDTTQVLRRSAGLAFNFS
jgi:uncharacterized repeat protein (TIGR02543 family)